ncbi:ATP-binding protein [Terasakiella sp. A23]|uniref:ATP-binding protein n=1 Tax=Terasakiella sp. FCG-A23 TaxID=3080561 RepID=UPI0029551936|nr:ATP-binding protein [Terasakiella sp. A23]MDV7339367.1 ATP-binding protein [Terasakiella sp. A23]
MGGVRFGVFAQLITSFVLAVIFTVAAAGVGIFSIQKFNDGIEEVALSRLPAMTLAYQLGQQSEAIVASAPMLVRVTTQAQRETISFRIADRVRWLQEIVDSLRVYDVDDNILEVINLTRQQLLDNYDRLDDLVKLRIDIALEKKERNRELQKLIREKIEFQSMPHELWGEYFYDLIDQLLIFETLTDTAQIAQLRQQLLNKFEELRKLDIPASEAKTIDQIAMLRKIALGESGLIALQSREKRVSQRIVGILAINERLSSRFVYSVNDLIRRMKEEIETDSQAFQQLVESRTQFLTLIVLGSVAALSFLGAIYIRRILKRLNGLKRSMRIHADGGETEIPLEGEDEISDMGHALKYLVDEIETREKEIRLSEARFRDVAEATSDWFWETDADLKFSLVSDRFFEITGFVRDDLIGRTRLEFSGRSGRELDDPDKWIHHSNDLSNRRRFRDFSYSIKCPDGVWRQIKVSGKPIFNGDGDFLGYRGTGSDITAETQARSRLMAANEIMPGAFALWDHENRLVLCNRKYYQYYKVLNDRIRPGVTFEELALLLEERKGIRDAYGYSARRREFRQKPVGVFMEALSNGRYLQVSEASTLDGGTVSLVIDITDRVEAETRLEQARLDSENANKAKSKFLAAASHDLRQPLHAIGMFLSALEDRRRKDDSEEAAGDLRIINNVSDSLEALRSLLNALLDISKLDAGVMKAEPTTVMLRPLFDRLIKQYEGRALEKSLRLKSFCPNIAVRSDPVLLERVLSNLISNAVRYTSEGGILLGARRRGNHVQVQVTDTGVGIPKERVKDIFVEFQQLENPARDRRRGLGLGLAIVERVLALLNHTLNLKSVVGKGATFAVMLPADKVVEVQDEEKPVEVALSGGEVPLIMVIDDEPDILEGMEHLIRGWKYNVVASLSSESALNALDEIDQMPSLILADYRLNEDRTGADCIRLIHEKLGEAIPAAIITGDTAPDRIQEAKASGFILLHKPLRPAKLRQLIRSVQAKSFTGG